MKKKPLIELTDITKVYKTQDIALQVLKEITLTIYEGDFVAITGPSGSGKSTLMNIIGLLDVPTKGKYILNNQNTVGLSEDELSNVRNGEIGFVFQSFNLLPRATALDNVLLPAIYKGTPKKERVEKAKTLLSQLGLSDKMTNRPNQLSGGQQQRVAIARSLVNDPAIILADEPTGNLDSKSGQDVMSILKKLNNEGKTIILITHEKDIAKAARKIIHLKDGLLTKN